MSHNFVSWGVSIKTFVCWPICKSACLFLSFEHYVLSMPRLEVLHFPDFHLKNIDIAFYFVVFVFEHFPLGYHWKPESLSSRLKTVRRLLYLIVQYLNQANLIQQLLF